MLQRVCRRFAPSRSVAALHIWKKALLSALVLGLIALGEWDDARHEAAQKDAMEQVRAANAEATANGTLGEGKIPSVKTMFEDVYKDVPWHLRRQRQQTGV